MEYTELGIGIFRLSLSDVSVKNGRSRIVWTAPPHEEIAESAKFDLVQALSEPISRVDA